MKKFLFLFLLLPVLSFSQSKKLKKADREMYNYLQSSIQYLSDDKLEGRRAGTRGEQLAMQFIAAQMQAIGLQPAGDSGFIQPFFIDEGLRYDSSNNFLIMNEHSFQLDKEFFPLSFSGSKNIILSSVSPALKEAATPWFFDVADLIESHRANPHFSIIDALYENASMAQKKGASAFIAYNSSSETDNVLFYKYDTVRTLTIPAVYISSQAFKQYVPDLTAFYNVKMQVMLTHAKRTAHNVLGFINHLAPYTIVVGAHYDHLGYGEDGNALDGKGVIHNGADDNASGTAALLQLAKMLKHSKANKNNYLFIAFSAEELGLLGSKYWLAHPTVSTQLNYMVNMDMIGRYDTAKKLTVGGVATSPAWKEVFNKNNPFNLKVHFDSSGTGPSDHDAFYRKNIPVLFFFTNAHSDYHKATDDWNKINFYGEMSIVKYIQHIIELANGLGKLSFSPTKETQQQTNIALPVTLGIMPDYSFEGTGVKVDAVSNGKAAEKAGVQTGDILLQLGDYRFTDVKSYMQALQHFKKGDTALLILKRKEQTLTLKVIF